MCSWSCSCLYQTLQRFTDHLIPERESDRQGGRNGKPVEGRRMKEEWRGLGGVARERDKQPGEGSAGEFEWESWLTRTFLGRP